MREKTFHRIIAVITILGIASVIAMVVYTWLLYKDCSVISYIGNKG
ncbi:MAG: hypothetical protein IJ740_07155 [Ruminococcus sp.]|nr:hypothetical protein [Ruminococcus sp.]